MDSRRSPLGHGSATTTVRGQCFSPVLARTESLHRPHDSIAYDCVKLIFVRYGSAVLYSEFGEKPVAVGDVVLLGANVLCGSEPEGHITVTTIYLDTDYVIDQVFWQHAGLLQDRLEAQGFAETVYSEPVQILRLGEDRAGMLMPWLDELVERSIDGGFAQNFYRIQALWFSIAHMIAPFVKASPVRVSASQRAHIRGLTPDLGHAESSIVLGKRDDPVYGQEELHRRVPSAGR